MVWAAGELKVSIPMPQVWSSGLTFPREVAAVQDSFRGSSNRTIYLLQDAHTNFSAQKNIASAVQRLIEKENLRTVYVEGGFGDVSLTRLKPGVDAKKREEIGMRYLRSGELSGAEYLSLAGETDFELSGVEDRGLYWKSLDLYRAVSKDREKFQTYLTNLNRSIDALKPEILRPLLRAFDRKRQAFLDGDLSFVEYFSTLRRYAGWFEIPLSDTPELSKMAALSDIEAHIDFKAANEEAAKAARFVQERQSEAAKLTSLNAQKVEAFYALLEEKLTQGVQLPPASPLFDKEGGTGGVPRNDYKELFKYFGYLAGIRAIKPVELLREQGDLEAALLKKLVEMPDEKKLLEADDRVREWKSLIDLSLLPNEFQPLSGTKELDLRALTGFLNEKIMELEGHYDRVIFLNEDFEKALETAEEFYALTKKRDGMFLDKMLARMAEKGESKAALVAGGYHSPNLKALLREKNISFVCVTPQILNETNTARYEKLLLSQKASSAVASSAGEKFAKMRGRIHPESADESAALALLAVESRPEGVAILTGARLSRELLGDVEIYEAPPKRDVPASGARLAVKEFLGFLSDLEDRYFDEWQIEKKGGGTSAIAKLSKKFVRFYNGPGTIQGISPAPDELIRKSISSKFFEMLHLFTLLSSPLVVGYVLIRSLFLGYFSLFALVLVPVFYGTIMVFNILAILVLRDGRQHISRVLYHQFTEELLARGLEKNSPMYKWLIERIKLYGIVLKVSGNGYNKLYPGSKGPAGVHSAAIRVDLIEGFYRTALLGIFETYLLDKLLRSFPKSAPANLEQARWMHKHFVPWLASALVMSLADDLRLNGEERDVLEVAVAEDLENIETNGGVKKLREVLAHSKLPKPPLNSDENFLPAEFKDLWREVPRNAPLPVAAPKIETPVKIPKPFSKELQAADRAHESALRLFSPAAEKKNPEPSKRLEKLKRARVYALSAAYGRGSKFVSEGYKGDLTELRLPKTGYSELIDKGEEEARVKMDKNKALLEKIEQKIKSLSPSALIGREGATSGARLAGRRGIPISRISEKIRSAYDEYIKQDEEITGRAHKRFVERDWAGIDSDQRDRVILFSRHLDEIRKWVAKELDDRRFDLKIWTRLRTRYRRGADQGYDADLARTFFYAVMRRMLVDENGVASLEFPDDGIQWPVLSQVGVEIPYREYSPAGGTREMLESVFKDLPLQMNEHNLKLALQETTARLDLRFGADLGGAARIQILSNVFYRNKGAYVMGRLLSTNGKVIAPIAFSFVNSKAKHIQLHAVLTNYQHVNNLFNSSRANFRVPSLKGRYREVVDFLWSILPQRDLAVVYSAIGFTHPGKIRFLQRLRDHLKPGVEFEKTSGHEGTLMIVMRIKGFPFVFKIIREKSLQREGQPLKGLGNPHDLVVEKYREVHRRDRIGRKLDAMKFYKMQFRASYFSDELLKEFRENFTTHVKIIRNERLNEDVVEFEDLYVQREVTPLDVYFAARREKAKALENLWAFEQAKAEASRAVKEIQEAIKDLGRAIQELAQGGIYIGDLQIKNFGVTLDGRVVSFDHDDMLPLEEVGFIDIAMDDVKNIRDKAGAMKARYRNPDYLHHGDPGYVTDPELIVIPEYELQSIRGYIMQADGDRRGEERFYGPVFEKAFEELSEAEFWEETKRNWITRDSVPHFYPYPKSEWLVSGARLAENKGNQVALRLFAAAGVVALAGLGLYKMGAFGAFHGPAGYGVKIALYIFFTGLTDVLVQKALRKTIQWKQAMLTGGIGGSLMGVVTILGYGLIDYFIPRDAVWFPYHSAANAFLIANVRTIASFFVVSARTKIYAAVSREPGAQAKQRESYWVLRAPSYAKNFVIQAVIPVEASVATEALAMQFLQFFYAWSLHKEGFMVKNEKYRTRLFWSAYFFIGPAIWLARKFGAFRQPLSYEVEEPPAKDVSGARLSSRPARLAGSNTADSPISGTLPKSGNLDVAGNRWAKFEKFAGYAYELEMREGFPSRITFVKAGERISRDFYPVHDANSGKVLHAHIGTILSERFKDFKDAITETTLGPDGKLWLGGGRPLVNGDKPVKPRAWARFDKFSGRKVRVFIKDGLVVRVVSVEPGLDARFATVEDGAGKMLASFYGALSKMEFNLLQTGFIIRGYMLTADGSLELGGREWMNLGHEYSFKKVDIKGIENATGKKAFITEAGPKKLHKVYSVPPGSADDSFEMGPLVNVFEKVSERTFRDEAGRPLRDFIVRGSVISPGGELKIGQLLHLRTKYYRGALVDVKIVDGQARYLRFVQDAQGNPILDVRTGKTLIIDLKDDYFTQLNRGSNIVLEKRLNSMRMLFERGIRAYAVGDTKRGSQAFADLYRDLRRVGLDIADVQTLQNQAAVFMSERKMVRKDRSTAAAKARQERAIRKKESEAAILTPLGALKRTAAGSKPSSSQEEAGLWKRALSGNPTAKKKLVESYLWLVLESADRLTREYSSVHAELIQEGALALHEILNDYLVSESSERVFEEFVRPKLDEILKKAKTDFFKHTHKTLSLDATITSGSKDTFKDSLADPSTNPEGILLSEERVFEDERLNALFKALTPFEQDILWASYVHEMEPQQIAGKFQMSLDELRLTLEGLLNKIPKESGARLAAKQKVEAVLPTLKSWDESRKFRRITLKMIAKEAGISLKALRKVRAEDPIISDELKELLPGPRNTEKRIKAAIQYLSSQTPPSTTEVKIADHARLGPATVTRYSGLPNIATLIKKAKEKEKSYYRDVYDQRISSAIKKMVLNGDSAFSLTSIAQEAHSSVYFVMRRMAENKVMREELRRAAEYLDHKRLRGRFWTNGRLWLGRFRGKEPSYEGRSFMLEFENGQPHQIRFLDDQSIEDVTVVVRNENRPLERRLYVGSLTQQQLSRFKKATVYTRLTSRGVLHLGGQDWPDFISNPREQVRIRIENGTPRQMNEMNPDALKASDFGTTDEHDGRIAGNVQKFADGRAAFSGYLMGWSDVSLVENKIDVDDALDVSMLLMRLKKGSLLLLVKWDVLTQDQAMNILEMHNEKGNPAKAMGFLFSDRELAKHLKHKIATVKKISFWSLMPASEFLKIRQVTRIPYGPLRNILEKNHTFAYFYEDAVPFLDEIKRHTGKSGSDLDGIFKEVFSAGGPEDWRKAVEALKTTSGARLAEGPDEKAFMDFFNKNPQRLAVFKDLQALKDERLIAGYGVTGSFSRGFYRLEESKDLDLAVMLKGLRPPLELGRRIERINEIYSPYKIQVTLEAFGPSYFFEEQNGRITPHIVRSPEVVDARIRSGELRGSRFIYLMNKNVTPQLLWKLHKIVEAEGPLTPEKIDAQFPGWNSGSPLSGKKHGRLIERVLTRRSELSDLNWPPAVVVYGSARIPTEHPYSALAYELGAEMLRRGLVPRTGAGPSIMEQVLRGYIDTRTKANIKPSPENRTQGIRILLDWEKGTNPFAEEVAEIDDFIVRKEGLHKNQFGSVSLPGGFGTLDELFESWRRSGGRGVVLEGEGFWKDLMKTFEASWRDAGLTSQVLPRGSAIIVNSPAEALDHVERLARLTPPHPMDPGEAADINRELDSALKRVSGMERAVTFIGKPYAGHELDIAGDLADRIVSEWNVPVRAGSRNGLLDELVARAKGKGWMDKLQSVLFIPMGPLSNNENELHEEGIFLKDESNHQLVVANNSHAYVFLPGGVGTMNKFFDIATVIQTKKIHRKPMILVGRSFWQPIVDQIRRTMLVEDASNPGWWDEAKRIPRVSTISPGDMEIFTVVDSAEEAMKALENALPSKRARLAENGGGTLSGVIRQMDLTGPDVLLTTSLKESGRVILVVYKYPSSKIINLSFVTQNPRFQNLLKKWGKSAYLGTMLLSRMVQKEQAPDEDGDLKQAVDSLSPLVESFERSATDYNRTRLTDTIFKSRILDFLQERKADWLGHLSFYMELLESYKRTGLRIWEGLFEAVKTGLVSTDLSQEEKNAIHWFVEKTHGFSAPLYKIFKTQGEENLLQVLSFGEGILNDTASMEDIQRFKDEYGDKVLLAVAQSVIPSSGASSIKEEKALEHMNKFLKAGNLWWHVPKALRDLGRFGGGDIALDEQPVKLRFQVVKGPLYGLWGFNAGVSIASDLPLWEKREFYLLAMIDESKNQAVGFIHLFEKEIGGQKYLTLPGINPSVEFLGQVKAREIYPMIEKAIETVRKEGGFAGALLPKDANILSNRKDIRDLAVKAGYPSKTLDSPVLWNTVPRRYTFKEVYVMTPSGARLASSRRPVESAMPISVGLRSFAIGTYLAVPEGVGLPFALGAAAPLSLHVDGARLSLLEESKEVLSVEDLPAAVVAWKEAQARRNGRARDISQPASAVRNTQRKIEALLPSDFSSRTGFLEIDLSQIRKQVEPEDGVDPFGDVSEWLVEVLASRHGNYYLNTEGLSQFEREWIEARVSQRQRFANFVFIKPQGSAIVKLHFSSDAEPQPVDLKDGEYVLRAEGFGSSGMANIVAAVAIAVEAAHFYQQGRGLSEEERIRDLNLSRIPRALAEFSVSGDRSSTPSAQDVDAYFRGSLKHAQAWTIKAVSIFVKLNEAIRSALMVEISA